MMRIGLISDTHGLLRPEALAELQGVDHIVHAGDIGNEEVIGRLEMLAPVTAVRGNNDNGAWAQRFPQVAVLEAEDVRLYVIHDIAELDIDPRAAGYRAVICGHSHKPHFEIRNDVLFVNPGSAGPRRFRLPISIGRLQIDGDRITPRLSELAVSPRRRA